MLEYELPDFFHLWIFIGLFLGLLIAIGIHFYVAFQRRNEALKNISFLTNEINDHSFNRLPYSEYKSIATISDAINKMAARLTHENDELFFQKLQLENVLNSMIESVIALNAKGEILNINLAGKKLFGLSQEFKGFSFVQIVRIKALTTLIESLINQHEPAQIITEIKHVSAIDQPPQYWRVCAATMSNKVGKIVGATLVIEEITQIRKIESAQRDFVANVSHELRTPLTVIKSACESLIDDGLSNKEFALKCMEKMDKHASRLSELIDDILALSTVENSHEEEQLFETVVNLNTLLEHVRALAYDNALRKQITIEISIDEQLDFPLHQSFIQQALLNLIQNAIHYSPEKKRIFLSGHLNDKDELVLRVKDEGIGIAKEHHARIFERFYRVNKARSRDSGGTGLGLAITKHIVDLHKGHITLESELNEGSTFTIFLPRLG